MPGRVRLRELLVGVEGVALLRHLYDRPDERAGARLAEVRRLLGDDSLEASETIGEAEPRAGYRAWSESYDRPGNPIVDLEQPAVWSVVDRLPPGRALDAACGTGRHARHLVELGHDVVGLDLTPEMLARAAASVPEASFVEADLRRIPEPDGSFELVVCGLALAHLAELEPGVAELARVLRPGGRLVVSVLHPFQAHLGWQAQFPDPGGGRRFVREHQHRHGDYLRAFRTAGLEVVGCLEPTITAEQARTRRRAYARIPEATLDAYVGLPAVLVWDAAKRR
jgi:SAM-dependent methyltransferase